MTLIFETQPENGVMMSIGSDGTDAELIDVCTDEGAGQIKTAFFDQNGVIITDIMPSIIAEGTAMDGYGRRLLCGWSGRN